MTFISKHQLKFEFKEENGTVLLSIIENPDTQDEEVLLNIEFDSEEMVWLKDSVDKAEWRLRKYFKSPSKPKRQRRRSSVKKDEAVRDSRKNRGRKTSPRNGRGVIS